MVNIRILYNLHGKLVISCNTSWWHRGGCWKY